MKQANEIFSSAITNPSVTWDNVYKPEIKVLSTVKPDNELTFDEFGKHIRHGVN